MNRDICSFPHTAATLAPALRLHRPPTPPSNAASLVASSFRACLNYLAGRLQPRDVLWRDRLGLHHGKPLLAACPRGDPRPSNPKRNEKKIACAAKAPIPPDPARKVGWFRATSEDSCASTPRASFSLCSTLTGVLSLRWLQSRPFGVSLLVAGIDRVEGKDVPLL